MENPESAFLGRGWSFPPTFSRRAAGVLMVSDNQDIQESLWILFSTSLGERIMLPGYGSQLWQMVFRSINNTLKTQIRDMIANAILNWEPRINVVEITVEPSAEVSGLLMITVEYVIRKTNARSNLVYPFYIEEGNLPLQAS